MNLFTLSCIAAFTPLLGSILAGFLGRALGIYRAGDVGPGIIASIIGAMILLAIYRAVFRRGAV